MFPLMQSGMTNGQPSCSPPSTIDYTTSTTPALDYAAVASSVGMTPTYTTAVTVRILKVLSTIFWAVVVCRSQLSILWRPFQLVCLHATRPLLQACPLQPRARQLSSSTLTRWLPTSALAHSTVSVHLLTGQHVMPSPICVRCSCTPRR